MLLFDLHCLRSLRVSAHPRLNRAGIGRRLDETGPPIFLTEVPRGFRDWKLVAVSRLTRGDGTSLPRAQLGNEIAIKAYREAKLPFPDGAIIVALHWNEISSDENDKVLAKGFPGAGIQSFISQLGREHAIHG